MLSQDNGANGVKGAKRVNDRSIKAIKRSDYNLPAHWVTDWLLYVIKQPVSFLITDAQYQLTDEELATFTAGITQMQTGTPLAYLTGRQGFWSLEFKVNEHTLIPRPDTEVLVEQVLAWIAANTNKLKQNSFNQNSLSNNNETNPQTALRLLDLGTGSGCIAISLAHDLSQPLNNQSVHSPINQPISQWHVTAVDYSAPALKIAQQNAKVNQVSNIDFIQSHWFESLPKDTKYQVIVSNPPYIDAADSHLQTLGAEPLSALVADNQGLADIEQIVSGSMTYLTDGGLLAIEHGYDQGQAVRQLFLAYPFKNIKTVQDYGGNDRVTMGELK
ncbi:MAG: peptide chain release factor N(5)-glutamine methyltransferase [Psychrobacter sp.]|nr:peptide chain release factor N(5)-glutamine methyltransferase [Psychrobacter sp.]